MVYFVCCGDEDNVHENNNAQPSQREHNLDSFPHEHSTSYSESDDYQELHAWFDQDPPEFNKS